jgi:hypothetical protein
MGTNTQLFKNIFVCGYLQAPPNYYAARLANYLRPVEAKRDDGYWIWMPAHGYMSVPRDEVRHNCPLF